MKISIKVQLTILFSIVFSALLFPSHAFATISGTKKSNNSPTLSFDTINQTKLANVVCYIGDWSFNYRI